MRRIHLPLLLVVGLALSLPNLGQSPLWDIDEGLNAEASREMLERGDWVVPRFNFALRTAKPVLINWLQMSAYSVAGVSEWTARLPSALCGVVALLGVYEIGRRLFDPLTGLLAGLVLGSCLLFGALTHAATPDAILVCCIVLTFLPFVYGTGGDPSRPVGRIWYALVGVAAGLGMLAKGPVALAVPALTFAVWLVWMGRWRQLLSPRILLVPLCFVLVAVPWYVLVGLETRGAFTYAFFVQENVGRALEPMERHGGPWWYHLVGLFVGLAPWSVFLGPTLWFAWRHAEGDRAGYRLVGLWAGLWLAVFSVAATKLPGYALPAYPAMALLTARYLVRWWRGELRQLGWLMPTSLALLAVIGGVFGVGLLVAGNGAVSGLQSGHPFAGLEMWAFIGLIPILAAGLAGVWLWDGRRDRVLLTVVTGCVLFAALCGSLPVGSLGEHTAPRALVRQSGACVPDREVRVAAFGWFQPSTVFYCRREVTVLPDEVRVVDLLAGPLEAYVFVSASDWERIRPVAPRSAHEVGRHWDMYSRREVVVVTNRREG